MLRKSVYRSVGWTSDFFRWRQECADVSSPKWPRAKRIIFLASTRLDQDTRSVDKCQCTSFFSSQYSSASASASAKQWVGFPFFFFFFAFTEPTDQFFSLSFFFIVSSFFSSLPSFRHVKAGRNKKREQKKGRKLKRMFVCPNTFLSHTSFHIHIFTWQQAIESDEERDPPIFVIGTRWFKAPLPVLFSLLFLAFSDCPRQTDWRIGKMFPPLGEWDDSQMPLYYILWVRIQGIIRLGDIIPSWIGR